MVIADLNNDGAPDLAASNSGGHDVSVLLNDGSGTFAAYMLYGAGNNPYGVAAGDLNGDGAVDLATADHAANTVSVLLNQCPAAAVPALRQPGLGLLSLLLATGAVFGLRQSRGRLPARVN